MSKIRINELARELEVKPSRILDLLPELGVHDKKTHSSSLDDDVAAAIRRHFGFDGPMPDLGSRMAVEDEEEEMAPTETEQPPARVAAHEPAVPAAVPAVVV